MTAQQTFKELGYEQKEYNEHGIQYIKKAKDSEMQRIGMVTTKFIEFYPTHKEIVIYSTTEHRDRTISQSDAGILNLEEFNAIQKQILELGW